MVTKTETKSFVLVKHHLKQLKLPTMHDVTGGRSRRGIASRKAVSFIGLCGCELAVAIKYYSCLAKAQEPLDSSNDTADKMIDWEDAQSYRQAAETIAYADIGTCATQYAIDALSCLPPFCFFGE